MKVAIIPARGGSKRIPRKNVMDFDGRPMISWAIEAALKSSCFDRIIVSTDDEEIAKISLSYGAEVPFKRPPELSGDHIPTIPVIQHAILHCNTSGSNVHSACCIYATNPLLDSENISRAEIKLEDNPGGYVFPVVTYASPIQRAFKRDVSGSVHMFDPEMFNARSQDLEEAWHDAGQFYWGRAETWLSGHPIFNCKSHGLAIARNTACDIDTAEDLKMALLMKKANRKNFGT